MIEEENTEQIKNDKYEFSNKKIFFLISIIFTFALLIRLYYYDYNIPLTLDSLNYFFYAMDIKITGQIPINYSLANNGWALFLSLFFSIFQFDDVNQYMQLQRIMTILISSLTVLPVYFLCKKFFNSTYSLVGAAIIGFEPHLIQNSLFGINDSLYIFLVALSFALFLSSKQKMIFLSFGIVAISTIVRSEGIFLFFTITLMYFIIYRKNRKELSKYVFAFTIFILILTPMMVYQNSIHGNDQMFERASNSLITHTLDPKETENSSGLPFILEGVKNFPKYFGWNMIPIWIVFIPLGIILILKNLNIKTELLISSIVIMSLPAFYAYSIPLQDGRYLFFLYPIFCVVSLFSINKFLEYISDNRKFLIIILILGGVIFLSIIYLENSIDNNHEKESFQIAKILSNSKKTVNVYLPENKYLEIADVNFKLIDFQSDFFNERTLGKSIRNSIHHNVTSIQINNIDTMNELIDIIKKEEITHIVIDIEKNKNELLKKIYYNENHSPLIKKIFDSNNIEFDYKIKIFEVNYNEINNLRMD